MVISKKPLHVIVAIALAILPLYSFANVSNYTVKKEVQEVNLDSEIAQEELAEPQDKKAKVDAYIQHHLQDSYDFTFFSDEKEGKHYGFSLPVILIDNGLKVFSSSKFHHGETIAEVDGNYYKLYHGKIYKTDALGTIEYDEAHHPTNVKPLDFSITKNVFSMLFTAILLLFMFIGLAKSYKKGPIPSGFGRVLEPLILFIRDEIAIPNIGEKKYRKFKKIVMSCNNKIIQTQ